MNEQPIFTPEEAHRVIADNGMPGIMLDATPTKVVQVIERMHNPQDGLAPCLIKVLLFADAMIARGFADTPCQFTTLAAGYADDDEVAYAALGFFDDNPRAQAAHKAICAGGDEDKVNWDALRESYLDRRAQPILVLDDQRFDELEPVVSAAFGDYAKDMIDAYPRGDNPPSVTTRAGFRRWVARERRRAKKEGRKPAKIIRGSGL